MHQRTLIRKYVTEMLKSAVDVGGRVFDSRTDAAFVRELPAVMVYYKGESADVRGGDRYNPTSYDRVLDLEIDVVTLAGVDELDRFAFQIERAFFEDWILGKRLPDYNPEKPDGLTSGASLKSTTPYTEATEGQDTIYGLQISFEVPYVTDATTLKKFDLFTEYYFEIQRADGVTTDPVLVAGEGEIG